MKPNPDKYQFDWKEWDITLKDIERMLEDLPALEAMDWDLLQEVSNWTKDDFLDMEALLKEMDDIGTSEQLFKELEELENKRKTDVRLRKRRTRRKRE